MPSDTPDRRPIIFISHSHGDHRLAETVHTLLKTVTGERVTVKRSSASDAIKTGESWKKWIDDSVLDCDVAVVVLTPSSLQGRWVTWEAGAVAGVQMAKLLRSDAAADEKFRSLNERRVRVLQFGLRDVELGPFAGSQAKDGLNGDQIESFIDEILDDFEDHIDPSKRKEILKAIERIKREFVSSAREDMRYSRTYPDESLIRVWMSRLQKALGEKDYRKVVAARRWINIVFLGAGNAEPAEGQNPEPIDFRLHELIAEAHRNLGEFREMAGQLELAAKLSPNDLPILRSLGEAYLKSKDPKVPELLTRMETLDSGIFKSDREAIALKCKYLLDVAKDHEKAGALLAEAEPGVVNRDGYLLGWKAILTMRAKGTEAARPVFEELEALTEGAHDEFWKLASRTNALIALGRLEDAASAVGRMRALRPSAGDLESATAHFAEIAKAYRHDFEWRAHRGG